MSAGVRRTPSKRAHRGSPGTVTRHANKKRVQSTTQIIATRGAIVEVFCEDDHWRRGTVLRTEKSFVTGTNELVVCQWSNEHKTWVHLPWKRDDLYKGPVSIPVPHHVWSTHIRLIQPPIATSTTTDDGLPRIQYDLHTAPRFMSDAEPDVLRAMQHDVRSTAKTAAKDIDQSKDTTRPRFNKPYFEGDGNRRNCSGGNPGLRELLEDVLPTKELPNFICDIANVAPERRSGHVYTAYHTAKNILGIDMARWVSFLEQDGATADTVPGLVSMRSRAAAGDPVAEFQAIPCDALKVFMLTLCSVRFKGTKFRGDCVIKVRYVQSPTPLQHHYVCNTFCYCMVPTHHQAFMLTSHRLP